MTKSNYNLTKIKRCFQYHRGKNWRETYSRYLKARGKTFAFLGKKWDERQVDLTEAYNYRALKGLK